MSGHRRVKDILYDDEEDFGSLGDAEYGAEPEGLSLEDQEHMRVGALRIRETFGSETGITNREIEEALWYYYFDLEKCIAYLRKQHAPPEPKKQKQKQLSKFDQAAQAARTKISHKAGAAGSHLAIVTMSQECNSPLTAAELFKDIPWLGVPFERRGNIVVEPLYPRGRLLGGSPNVPGKPSKLAALAAARKISQQNERTSGGTDSVSRTSTQSTSIALLDRLSAGDKRKLNDEVKTKTLAEEQRIVDVRFSTYQNQSRGYPIHSKINSMRVVSEKVSIPTEYIETSIPDKPKPCDVRAAPSIFAQTMFDSSGPGRVTEANSFSFPRTSDVDRTNINGFAGPSPDDVVMNAQAKGAKKSKSGATETGMETPVNGLSNGVANITIEGSKRKNLDVLALYEKSDKKNAANFVVIGHVDHGKSTLMGRLLYDLHVVNQRSMDKLRTEATSIGKSSFALAWVMDSTSEERNRGITVDIATNHFETANTRFTILDAPGHRDFIPNMIAGASQADFAVLVIDASTNAFEAGLRGQTKEHALLVRSMGISRLVVTVNKMDAAAWSEARFTEITQQTTAFLTAAGFLSKNLSFIPCAGLTGANIATPPPSPSPMPWYTGPTLLTALETSAPSPTRALSSPLRLTISDIFRGGVNQPLSISGRLDAGSLQTGDTILAMPSGETATVKGIEIDSMAQDWTVAGQIATLHLSGIDPVHLRLGDIVCDPVRQPVKNAMWFTAKVLAFEHLTPGWVHVHKGRMHGTARITTLVAVLDKASGTVEKKKPRIVKPGAVARVRVELEERMPLEVPGRVVLRSEGQTIAAGLLEEVG